MLIVNIYNEGDGQQGLHRVIQVMRAAAHNHTPPTHAPHLVWLGDFNLHHLMWDEAWNVHCLQGGT